MSVKQKLLDKVLKDLAVLNAEFAIRFEGVTYGTLTVQQKGDDAKKKRVVRRGIFDKYDYKKKVAELNIGEVYQEIVETADAESFRASIGNKCSSLFGKGSYMTSLDDLKDGTSKVELLRLF